MKLLFVCLIATASVLLAGIAVAADEQGAPSPKIKMIENIVYARIGDKELRLGLALPEEASAKQRPVILWITGGGWKQLSYKSNRAAWFAQHGYVGAHIDYRLSNEAIFPAQIYDCKAAIRFLRAHAEEYNLDPNHIGVWGGSAGAHLAALLATAGDVKELEGDLGNNSQSSRVQAFCGWYGVYDLTSPSRHDPAKKKPGPVAELLGGTPQQKPELARLASPICQITKGDAPALLFHGDADQLVPMQQSEKFCEALKTGGVEATFVPVKNGGHGFTAKNMDPDADKMHQMMLAFFDKHLKVH